MFKFRLHRLPAHRGDILQEMPGRGTYNRMRCSKCGGPSVVEGKDVCATCFTESMQFMTDSRRKRRRA